MTDRIQNNIVVGLDSVPGDNDEQVKEALQYILHRHIDTLKKKSGYVPPKIPKEQLTTHKERIDWVIDQYVNIVNHKSSLTMNRQILEAKYGRSRLTWMALITLARRDSNT